MNKQHDTYKVRDEYIENNSRKKLGVYFRERGKQLQDQGKSGEGKFDGHKLLSHKIIAERMGISVEELRKKLYGRREFSRDWLALLCAAYGLDSNAAEKVFRMVDKASLDAGVRREECIILFLDAHKDKLSTRTEINNELISQGFDPIDAGKKKNQQKNRSRTVAFDSLNCQIYSDDGDPYNSLSTRYMPNLECKVSGWVCDHGKHIKLEVSSDGECRVYDQDSILPTVYKDLRETGKYMRYFNEISYVCQKKKKELDDSCFDSKNYKGRFGARLVNDVMHVFYEVFNYDFPERNEYFLMDYADGNYSLHISHYSMFMEFYLQEEEYRRHYGHRNSFEARERFSTIDELNELVTDKNQPLFRREIYEHRIRVFSQLQTLVKEKLKEIRSGKEFVNNLEYIWDNPYNVLVYYHVENAFDCVFDNESDEIYSNRDSAEFLDAEGNTILVTFEDLKRAFELGFSDIAQIIRVKQTKGSVDAVLS